MSAPLVVTTRDKTVWTRRAVTSEGIALYAPEAVCKCPEFVMATLAELALNGIVGTADVLPVPVGAPLPGLSLEREQEIRESHPGAWYGGPWTQDQVDSDGSDPAYCRVVHHQSGTVLATLPDFAGGIALFLADAHDAVPELLAEVDRLRARVGELEERALPDFGEHLARLATPEGRAAAEERVMAALAQADTAPTGPVVMSLQSALDVTADRAEGAEVTS